MPEIPECGFMRLPEVCPFFRLFQEIQSRGRIQENMMKTQQKNFTKVSMLGHFLKGCTRFFVFTIICSFLVTVFEMLIPQVIRQTVDAVIGEGEMNAPGFITRWFVSKGGAAYFRENLWMISLIVMGLL